MITKSKKNEEIQVLSPELPSDHLLAIGVHFSFNCGKKRHRTAQFTTKLHLSRTHVCPLPYRRLLGRWGQAL